jgi:hypothetical protein
MSKRISVRGPRSAFAADVAGPGALGGWLFVECDALSFIQLVEASLHRAAMEKPFLAAVVANETEPSVTNESFDRTTPTSESP